MDKTNTKKNLQTALSMELTAMHQYQLHAGVLDDWGLNLLASKMREEMSEELEHSEEYLSRILFLKGSPELTMAKTPVLAPSLKEMFESDLADEKEAIDFYTKASIQASEDGDIGTRTLFERIALEEEQHMSWLELQLDLLARMGEPAYISKHMPSPAQATPQV
jgi:bacterioferritin